MRNKTYNEGRNYTAKDIFLEYEKSSKKYPLKKIDLLLSPKKKGSAKLTYKQFYLIVFTFFKIYLSDLFYGKFKILYSPFIGKMELVRLKAKNFGHKKFPNPTESFGLLWFDRISKRHWYTIRLKKTRSSRSGHKGYSFFTEFQNNTDLYLLPNSSDQLKLRGKNKTLFDE